MLWLLTARSEPPPGIYLLYWFAFIALLFPIGTLILGQLDGWKRVYRRFPAQADFEIGAPRILKMRLPIKVFAASPLEVPE